MPDHYHCPAPGCYWRIQFRHVCSRCGGATVATPGCCEPGARLQFLNETEETVGQE